MGKILVIKGVDFSATSIETVKLVADKISINVLANPTEGGICTGTGVYDEGTQINISATPNDKYEFDSWDDGNTNLICIINDDLTIDIKKLNKNDKNNYDVEIRIFKDQLPEFIQFNEVECNFRVNNFGWDSSVLEYGPENREILPHDILTLFGCPKIVYGDFICEKLGLISFDGCPRKIYGDLIIKSNNLSSFKGMPDFIQGCLNISNNKFKDESWEYVILHKNDEFAKTDFNTWNFSKNLFIKYDKVDLKQTLL